MPIRDCLTEAWWIRPSRWFKVVLPSDRQPRFGVGCCRCGRTALDSTQVVKVEGCQPSARDRVTVPICDRCSRLQNVVALGLAAMLVLLIYLAALPPRRSFAGPTDWSKTLLKIGVFGAVLGAYCCLICVFFRPSLEILEGEDGRYYLFRSRVVARQFVHANQPVLPSTTAELLDDSR